MVKCSFMNKWAVGSGPVAVTSSSDFVPAPSKKSLDIQASIKCGFTVKRVRDMIRTYSQMHRGDKYWQQSSIIRPVGVNDWVFVYEIIGCGFKSRCSHLNFNFAPASSKEFLDIQATIDCGFTVKRVRDMIRTYSLMYLIYKLNQLNHLASLTKWLSFCLWTKWLWIQVRLHSLNFQISRLLRARSSLMFRQH